MPAGIRACRASALVLALLVLLAVPLRAQSSQPGGVVAGVVRDQTGGALPGVAVDLASPGAAPRSVQTDTGGRYRFEAVAPGTYLLSLRLINFGEQQRPNIVVAAGAVTTADVVLGLSLNADVVVTGKRSFVNLADADDPAQNLVGIAQSASQGAITARQLEVRPVLRAGEVLETVPGVIITQHSGEGKANQYFLRGFNLDHGSDFATTVAGVPVNMPTHAHSQGYSDINFLIPELVTGVQFSKGPYFSEQGDFATAGAANITYATELERPMVSAEVGGYGFGRGLVAASRATAGGQLLGALELSTNAGPWDVPDDYRKVNGVARYTRGDAVNGLSLTAMGYHGSWNATEASPARAIESGLIGRFGSIDDSDGGRTGRYSLTADWQRSGASTVTKVSAYAMRYDLDLTSNFTFYLDDPVHGDQGEQIDRRWVTGARVSQRRLGTWRGHDLQHTVGVQVRNDAIGQVALLHTERGERLETRTDASARVSSLGAYAQTELEWTPRFRMTAGLRADGSHYRVDALDLVNSGTASAGLVSPKGGLTFGPWRGTEFYANGGFGFHSNNALGTTITSDADGNPVERVTPLVRANGAELGMRSVLVPHLQTTVSWWGLRLGSELVYNGDLGATEPGPASERHGVEVANYYSPFRWLVFDVDVSFSRATFTSDGFEGQLVPEAVNTVISAGASVDGLHRMFGSLRWRYFGPRALLEDDSVRSAATSLTNLQAGYQPVKRLRVTADLFNLFDTKASDIDYFFTSRLPGEPLAGIDDRHYHPAVPRTLRLNATVTF
ncbi:MAG: TonB-dependent receptor [Vicinamibacterales bacterium]